MTEGQEARKACALTLYQLAADIVAEKETLLKNKSEENRLRVLGTAGALAESYSANIEELRRLLKCKYDRPTLSHDEAVKEWQQMFDWLIKEGERPPILHNDGTGRLVPLPFDTVHATVREAYLAVMAFRREVCRK